MATKKAATPATTEPSKSKQYRVRVKRELSAITNVGGRNRGGLLIPIGDTGYVGSLTDAQLEAVRADTYLIVEEHKA